MTSDEVNVDNEMPPLERRNLVLIPLQKRLTVLLTK